MVRLSVNLNKVALIRNSRGSNYPNLVQVAQDCERFGAQGITVHPRPDERHCKFSDLPLLKAVCTTEFNIEGYPDENFIQQVLAVQPHQCTLVPDNPSQITSDHGWNTIKNKSLLQEVIATLQAKNIRVSLFIDDDEKMIEGAKAVGADRVEFYTGPFAKHYHQDKQKALGNIVACADLAHQIGLGINAGHDLNLENLAYFKAQVPHLAEVSIGHALITDALYYGLQNTIQMYLAKLR
ncbi:MAG: pyridoxine 5'-phosphate synthase [Chitinophagales bacterium]|nr:pyridoxine 5'-phosphate synthase [Chitinophagales bacterium]